MATLDLHRYDAEAARRRVIRFVADECARRRDLVLVVVGRGRHSRGGQGVLRSEIVDWLTTLPAAQHVLAFRTAPRELGGNGCLLVLLAGPRNRH
jgi:DNA-nicking Smr family endonuclease